MSASRRVPTTMYPVVRRDLREDENDRRVEARIAEQNVASDDVRSAGAQPRRRNAGKVIHALARAMQDDVRAPKLKQMICAFSEFRADIKYRL